MAKPYQGEIAKLAETLGWALSADISQLERAIQTAKLGPLVSVGSGGSLSTAHALAYYHRLATGHVSSVLTPLESVATRVASDTAVWLLSASGNNVDVVGAAKALVMREPRQIAAVVGREDSKLSRVAHSHPYMDLLTYVPPTGKDGFLATNSLFGASVVLAKAYSIRAPSLGAWSPAETASLRDSVDTSSALVQEWRELSRPLWERDTTVVLHGSSGTLGAVDLESKFTEAAVGHAQIADYRNFAHGRHHWLAKRGHQSAVVALISEDDQDIAERTLELLPPEIPVVRIALGDSAIHASLVSLVAAFRLTEWAGQARGIDPGDPGVPEFGRRIYHLAPQRQRTAALPTGVTRRAAAAIERKSGRTISQLTESSQLASWKSSLKAFQQRLTADRIGAIVVDYDGTVVDTRDRFDPPSSEMVEELIRLLNAGIPLGIATGRGRSVRQAFQAVIPQELWPGIVVGYYNGSEVGTLDDSAVPHADQSPVVVLRSIAERLASHPELADQAFQEDRRNQLTLTPQGALGEERLWEIVQSIVRDAGPGLAVLRSSHSIDVLSPAASKRHVFSRLRGLAPEGLILAIGDRGRWPGNDHELLSSPLSLSVDQCSPAADTCWNLGTPGQRGAAVTLEYLRAVEVSKDGQARVNGKALR